MVINWIKLHPKAQLPRRAHQTDAGYDVFAVEETRIVGVRSGGYGSLEGDCVVPIGLQLAHCPPDWFLKVEAKSGLGFKKGIYPHPGIIDPGYRGELSIKMYGPAGYTFEVGQPIAQLIPYLTTVTDHLWVKEATETTRGDDGLGSTWEV